MQAYKYHTRGASSILGGGKEILQGDRPVVISFSAIHLNTLVHRQATLHPFTLLSERPLWRDGFFSQLAKHEIKEQSARAQSRP